MSTTTRRLEKDTPEVGQLLEQHDTWLFDCDGVLFRESTPIPGSVAFLESLRAKAKRVLFVTNSPSLSRINLQRKLNGFGIQADIDEIFSSAHVAATYIASIMNLPSDKKVYLIGPPGAGEELTEHDVKFAGGTDSADHTLVPFDFGSYVHDESIAAVLSCNDPNINYTKVCKAFQYLTRNAGCAFLASDGDATWPAPEGIMLGSGSQNALLSYALGGVAPVCFGKPSEFMLDCIRAKHAFDPKRAIMIGDRLDSDIKFGARGEFTTVLVLSGVTREGDLEGSDIVPNYMAECLGELLNSF